MIELLEGGLWRDPVVTRRAGRLTGWRALVWAGIAIAALGLAACSNGSTVKIASATSTGGPAATGGSADPSSASAMTGGAQAELAGYIAHQRLWVACMRKNKIDVPDPDKFGAITITIKKTKAWLTAGETCKSLIVSMPESVRQMRQQKLTPAEISLAFALSKCMQTHGMPSYPDPGPDGYVSEDKDKNIDESSATWQKANRACAAMIPQPKVSGTPGG